MWRSRSLGGLLLLFFTCSVTPFAMRLPAAEPHPDRAAYAESRRSGVEAFGVGGRPIRLKSEEFTGVGTVAANLDLARGLQPEGAETHVLIQFDRSPDADTRGKLATLGIRLVGYIPENTYFASVPRSADALAVAEAGVAWLGAIYPADKGPRWWQTTGVGLWALHLDDTADLRVKCFEASDCAGVSAAVAAMGGRNIVVSEGLPQIALTLEVSRIGDLLALDEVRWVEETPPPAQPFLDSVRTNIQAQALQEAPYGLSGAGVAVGVWDVGVVDTHSDFAGRLTIANPGGPDGVRLHATHVAGIVGGSGSGSARWGGYANQWRGVAPGVHIYSYDTEQSASEHVGAIRTNHVVISQNSWGVTIGSFFGNCDLYGDYSFNAPEYDQIVNGSAFGGRVSVVFAAGNGRKDGGAECTTDVYFLIGPPGTAKNVITVGAINSDNNTMTAFSSWGPVQDGRLKPDLVAPGSQASVDFGVTSTGTNNTYTVTSGTSMAAPAVSGAIALLVEDFHSRYNGQDPLPSTVKGLLLHTAEDLGVGTTGCAKGPDFASGYGRLQAKAAVDHFRTGGFLVGQVLHGQTNSYTLTVPDATPMVKVTLVWDDAAGADNASVALVNDLDLVVLDTTGARKFPWTLDPAHPAAAAVQTREDHLNVVEQVSVDSNVHAGKWTVRVVGKNVPQTGPQKYSLVFSPAGIPATPILTLEEAVINDQRTGNGNGVVDPGETIEESVRLRNTDGPVAAGTTGHLSTEDSRVKILQADSSYPDILSGAVGTNLTPFAYRVSKTVPSGSVLRFVHVAANGEQRFTNFFTRVIGRLEVTNTTTTEFAGGGVPMPIPDNRSTNAVLTIPDAGTVLGVGVALRVDHPWAEDLQFELEAPDGTRRLLVLGGTLSGKNLGSGSCDSGGQPTRFEDSATTLIRAGLAPYAGTFRPEQSLAGLVGRQMQGDWRLRAADISAEDTGALICWNLRLTYEQQGYVAHLFDVPPIAKPQALSVLYAISTNIVLTGEDSDEDSLRFSIVDAPVHGRLSGLDQDTGKVIYTPESGYSGPDRFTFVANDGYTNSAPVAVDLTVLEPRAELSVSVTAASPRAVIGQELVFRLVVTNRGPNTATAVVVNDALSQGAEPVSASASQGTATVQAGGALFEMGEVPAGGFATATIVARAMSLGVLTNSAVVGSSEVDSDLSDNQRGATALANYEADLGVSAAVVSGQVLLQSPFTWMIMLTNQGPHDASNARLRADLPEGVVLMSVVTSQGDFTSDSRSVQCAVGGVAAGATAYVKITLNPVAMAAMTNSFEVSADEFDFDLADNATTLVTVVNPSADLGVRDGPHPSVVPLGQNVTYTLLVTNKGPSVATGIVLVDSLPANVQFMTAQISDGTWVSDSARVTGSIAQLPPGRGASLSVTVRALALGSLTNAFTVNALEADVNPADNIAYSKVQVIPCADLSLSGSADSPLAALDHPVAYTWWVTNSGPSAATSVRLEDLLPVGLVVDGVEAGVGATVTTNASKVVVEWPSLAVGGVAGAKVSVSATHVGWFTNRARVTASELDLNLTDNLTEATHEVRFESDLAVTVHGPPGALVAGRTVTFVLSVTNLGPHAASAVVASNWVSAGAQLVGSAATVGIIRHEAGLVSWDLGALDVGAGAIATFDVAVGEVEALTCVAVAGAAEVDLNPANNSVSTTIRSEHEAGLAIGAVGRGATVLYGGQAVFDVAVTNTGPHPATEVRVLDVLPSGRRLLSVEASQGTYAESEGVIQFEVGELGVGETARLVVTVEAGALGTLTNRVSVSGRELDTFTADNEASATILVVPSADIALQGRFEPASLVLGRNFACVLTVTNAGPHDADGVRLEERLPAGVSLVGVDAGREVGVTTNETGVVLLVLGEIAAGQGMEVRLALSASQLGSITNRATVLAAQSDPDPSDNTSAVAGVVVGEANLSLTLSGPTAPVLVGGRLALNIVITNRGPATAMGMQLTDFFSKAVGFVSADVDHGTWTATPTTHQRGVQLDFGALAAGDAVNVTIVLEGLQGGAFTNVAAVFASEFDPDYSDNAARLLGTVQEVSDLGVAQSVSLSPAALGYPVTYSITVTNRGPATASGVVLTDLVPKGGSFVSAGSSQGDWTFESGVLKAALGEIVAQGSASMLFTLIPNAAGMLTNQIAVVCDNSDLNPDDNASTLIVPARPDADLEVRSTGPTTPVVVKAETPYSFTVINRGPNDAAGVKLVHPIPSLLQVQSIASTHGTYAVEGGVLICHIGRLTNGEMALVTIVTRPVEPGAFTNVVSVSGETSDRYPDNNLVSVTRDARYTADLRLSVVSLPETLGFGESVVYSLSVTNLGPHGAGEVEVTGSLSDGFGVLSTESSQGDFTNRAGAWVFRLGALEAGAGAWASITFTVNRTGIVANAVSVSAYEHDMDASNNSVTVTNTIRPVADLEVVSIEAADPAVMGSEVLCTVLVGNHGPNVATRPFVTFPFPVGTEFVSAEAAGGGRHRGRRGGHMRVRGACGGRADPRSG